MDKCYWQNNVKSETVVPTETCLHHHISGQVVARNEQTVFLADRMADYSKTWRGGLCVYSITLMLDANTHTKWMDSVSQMSNL